MSQTQVNSTAVITDSRSRSTSSVNLTEICGYRLEERIGLGGFGEVWRGIAPGGFAKAIKILFGSLSGPQAETELRSLHRIRDLRHPFLLNIERVEIIDDRVVVVSELADRSLDERFREAVGNGQKGIPREELLGYLRDAADALDFMSEQHGLQHLDIKPENLLLQGSHAKVGDFGLTKSLTATGHSQVNGFTPLYAPPELFDGRADRSSDQYSLAIVYQTMLTGIPPFNGRSAAQLTSQHLKSPPDLTALHPSDRPVVARALSKNPQTRFHSCRQFIDELAKRRYANSTLPRSENTSDTQRIASLTEVVEDGANGRRKSQLLPPATPLPPAKTEGSAWFLRPTVFIGLGGMGTRVIESLQQRCQHLFPNASLPLLQFVCIDSDSESLEAVARRTAGTVATSMRNVAIPLRSSHEYRKNSGDHLNWLSRRWLFNIPRSGNVEGMRPLGRLAFVDHLHHIRQQFQKSLELAFTTDAASKTQQETQIPCSLDAIDFVIIGATSGGTSSGSLLDAAWLAKSLVEEKRLPPCTVSAVLMHGTGHGRQSADMQDASTVSFLKELHYFSLPGVHRPGPATQGRSSFDSAMPLDSAWLLHLGDDLTSAEFNRGLEAVTDYLELRTFTPVRRDMDVWRQIEHQSPNFNGELQLRTFGVARVASDTWELAESEAGHLGFELIQSWLNPTESQGSLDASAQLPSELTSLVNELALTSERVIEMVPRLLNAERSRQVDEYACDIWSRLSRTAVKADVAELVANLITQDTSAESCRKNSIGRIVEEIRRDLATGMSQSVRRIEQIVQRCCDVPRCVVSAEQVGTVLMKAIDNAVATGARQQSDLRQAFSDLCTATGDSVNEFARTNDVQSLKSFCRQYCMLLICQTVCQCVSAHMKLLRESVKKIQEEQIVPLRRRLSNLSACMKTPLGQRPSIPESILSAFEEFVLSGGRLRPSSFLQRDPKPADASLLTAEATSFLFRNGSGSSCQDSGIPATAAAGFPGSARPGLRHAGGGQRVVVALPEQIAADRWKSRLQGEFGNCVSVLQVKRDDVSVLCEVEGIAISTVVDLLSHLKPNVVELAERIHSRHDIPW